MLVRDTKLQKSLFHCYKISELTITQHNQNSNWPNQHCLLLWRSANLLWNRNCSTLNEPMMSHEFGRLADSWQTLMHMQQRVVGTHHSRHLEGTTSYQKMTISTDA